MVNIEIKMLVGRCLQCLIILACMLVAPLSYGQSIGNQAASRDDAHLVSIPAAESKRSSSSEQVRKFRRPVDDLQAIREYLLNASPDARGSLRFLSLSNWHNNPRYSSQDLQIVRSAAAKLINSLSWQSRIVLPEVVPESDGAIIAIDLRELQWSSAREWLSIINLYPYGLKYDYVRDQELKQMASDVQQLANTELPLIRADWFAFTASRPPLYHELLDLPLDLKELEERLNLNRESNIASGNVARAGFGSSAVSQQNRLIERHETKYGAYWISYDFAPRRGRGDLIRFPLGPKFNDNRFNRHAFEHDGSQAIFNLPNGLHGYMLVDAKGQRIDGAAAADVVYDPTATAGTPAMTNGLSCIHCHSDGIASKMRDEIRDTGAFSGEALEQIQKLYIEHAQFARLIEQDRQQYRTALRATLESHDDLTPDFEPISYVAKSYIAGLNAQDVACELGIESIDLIAVQIENDRDLRKLGLATLIQAQPGTIQRARWEAVDGTSLFQDVAVELKLGTPYLPGTTRGLKSRTSSNSLHQTNSIAE